jgi:hypothetical protein
MTTTGDSRYRVRRHGGFMLALLFSLTAFAAPVCLDGFYDLGKNAAALGFACENDGAMIVFCNRKALLEKGICTGSRDRIACRWEEDAWKCEEDGRFEALIRKISETQISYKFKSHFNEGELVGEKIFFRP